jgi:hypothetical protein
MGRGGVGRAAFVIYYDFSKLLQGVICPVLESSGGKKSIFIDWGVMCSNPHRLGGKVDFSGWKEEVSVEQLLSRAWRARMPLRRAATPAPA